MRACRPLLARSLSPASDCLYLRPLNLSRGSPVENLRALIRDVPDFPTPGILFRDITPLLSHATGLRQTVQWMSERFLTSGVELVVGIESRGFIFGAPLAVALGTGFVPIRKLGKLPARTVSREYGLEYGASHLEIHADAVRPGQRVLLVDDVLATGGTAAAGVELVEELGGVVVAAAFLIELAGLRGRSRLPGHEVVSALVY
jgi:adenine phosphoribosyltransferase